MQLCRNAHENGSQTTSLRFAPGDQLVATRGGDDTLKVWDVRKFTTPVANFQGLCNLFDTTDCIFSPGGNLLLTGVSVRKGQGNGYFSIYNVSTWSKMSDIGMVHRLAMHCGCSQLLISKQCRGLDWKRHSSAVAPNVESGRSIANDR
jgi:WD repeat-containing protein 70